MRYGWEVDRIGMCAGTIDEDTEHGGDGEDEGGRRGTGMAKVTLPKPGGHIFTMSKAGWYEIPDDGLPRWEGFSPEMKRKLDEWEKHQ